MAGAHVPLTHVMTASVQGAATIGPDDDLMRDGTTREDERGLTPHPSLVAMARTSSDEAPSVMYQMVSCLRATRTMSGLPTRCATSSTQVAIRKPWELSITSSPPILAHRIMFRRSTHYGLIACELRQMDGSGAGELPS